MNLQVGLVSANDKFRVRFYEDGESMMKLSLQMGEFAL